MSDFEKWLPQDQAHELIEKIRTGDLTVSPEVLADQLESMLGGDPWQEGSYAMEILQSLNDEGAP